MYCYLRPDILKEFDPKRSALIEASAGTGKTFTIEHLVVELLITGAATIEQILLVTFTEKAVGELKERIRSTIQKVLASKLKESELQNSKELFWRLNSTNTDRLKQALDNYDQATIVTIHRFCNKVLNDFPIDTKQPLSCQMCDDKAINKIAQAKVLAKSQYDNPQVKTLLEQVINTLSGDKDYLESINNTLTSINNYNAPIYPPITQDSDNNNAPQPSLYSQLIQTILEEIKTEQAQLKRDLGVISFNDILHNVNNALLDPINGKSFSQTLRKCYPYGIIDEFQDTDEIQWSIFRHIYLEQENPGVLYLVGDPKQAIYGFRGADVNSYLEAKNLLRDKGLGDIIDLKTNYRSTEAMIEALNSMFNADVPKTFFTQNISCPPNIDVGNRDARIIYPTNQNTAEQQPPPLIIGYENTAHSKDSFAANYNRWLAHYLKQLLLNKPLITLKKGQSPRELKPSDIFILGQSNNDLLAIAKELQYAHIPYAFFKQEGLFNSYEAKDVADLLSAIASPYDNHKRLKALLTPFFAVPLKELAYYKDLPGNHPFLTKLAWWQQLAEQHHYAELFNSIIQDSGLAARLLFTKDDQRDLHSYQRIFDILAKCACRGRYELEQIIDILYQYIEGKRQEQGQEDDFHQQQFSHDAIQLLTMHKSKGLEAPVVAITGALSGINNDNISDVNLFYRNGKRQLFIGKYGDSSIKSDIVENIISERQRLMYVALTRAICQLILPYWDPQQCTASFRQSYLFHVNQQLERMINSESSAKKLLNVYNIHENHKTVTEQKSCKNNNLNESAPPSDNTPVQDDVFPEKLIDPQAELDCLTHAKTSLQGPLISSYSRRKHLSDHGYSVELDDSEINNSQPEENISLLPGGTTFGTMVHELFEEVKFEAIKNNSFSDWFNLEETQALLDDKARIYNFDSKVNNELANLIYQALAQKSVFPNQEIAPLCQLEQHLHEQEFFYPAPNNQADDLCNPIPGITVERGYIKGYLDMLFVYEGRYYVLDWKTDRLPNYEAETINQHVEKNYIIQRELYSIALYKLLHITNTEQFNKKFGGIIYLFVRCLEPGKGRYLHRASLDELQQYYQNLATGPLG